MRKLKTLIWGIIQLISLRLTKRKLVPNDELVKKTFNFVGSAKRPHPGMSLFAYCPETGQISKVLIFKNDTGSNGFINPDCKHVWALNRKSAIKKISKDENITLSV